MKAIQLPFLVGWLEPVHLIADRSFATKVADLPPGQFALNYPTSDGLLFEHCFFRYPNLLIYEYTTSYLI